MASVPDTNTFSLQDVVDVINPTTDDLQDCINDSVDGLFDIEYKGDKNALYCFRNYGALDGSTSTIYIIDIFTVPWYRGDPPGESGHYNYFKMVYLTNSNFDADVNGVQNITSGTFNQSDDANVIVTYAAGNVTFVATTRPAVANIHPTGEPHNTLLSTRGLYFKVLTNTNFKSLSSSVVYTNFGGGVYAWKKLFDLVDTLDVGCSVSPSAMKFDSDFNNLEGGTTLTIDITNSSIWYAIVPSWVSMTLYYGFADATPTISVTDHDCTGTIYIYRGTNEAAQTCDITVYAPGYQVDFGGYISWGYDGNDGSTIYFLATNTSASDHQKTDSSSVSWETRLTDQTVVDSGSVSSGSLGYGQDSHPTDAITTSVFDEVWVQVSGYDWVLIS